MPEDLGEKTEQATPRRRSEAREEGNLAKSQDLSSASILLAVTVTIWVTGGAMLDHARRMMGDGLDAGRLTEPLRTSSALEALVTVSEHAMRIGLPVLLLMWAAAYLAQFLQVGWLLSGKPLRPQLSRLNPLSGAKRIFGISGLVKVSLDSLKVLVVVVVVTATLMQYAEEIVHLTYLTPLQALLRISLLMLDLALRVLAVLLLLGFLDYLYQRWKHNQDLRMTKQEVKDEMKQTDGDPETKRRRMRMQQQIAMQRISAAVPRADVIVTNPEHISVAIQYEQDTMRAPRVIAKGAELLAFRIRQLAVQHGVPIVERKPLARALYRQVAVGQEVPPEFYKAVAEILAYVYRIAETSKRRNVQTPTPEVAAGA